MNTIEELNAIGSTAVEEEEIGKRQTLLVLVKRITQKPKLPRISRPFNQDCNCKF